MIKIVMELECNENTFNVNIWLGSKSLIEIVSPFIGPVATTLPEVLVITYRLKLEYEPMRSMPYFLIINWYTPWTVILLIASLSVISDLYSSSLLPLFLVVGLPS